MASQILDSPKAGTGLLNSHTVHEIINMTHIIVYEKNIAL